MDEANYRASERLELCPVCHHTGFTEYLECQDHIASQQRFTLVKCPHCGFVFTNPRPSEADAGVFYESPDYLPHAAGSGSLLGFVWRSVRTYAVGRKLALINTLAPRGRLLDIGCGTGEFLKRCHANGWQTFGVEPSASARQTAQKGGAVVAAAFQRGDSTPATLDVITLWHALEHIHNPGETIRLAAELLRSGGALIVAVPNHASHDAQVYGALWAAYDVPRHLHHFTPATMQRLVEGFGLRHIRTLPMWFDSVYVSLMSERYRKRTSGHGSVVRAVWTGLISNARAWFKPGTCSSQIYIFRKEPAEPMTTPRRN